MSSSNSPIRIEEELGDASVLIIDHDFPFLADTLAEKLTGYGCDVDRTSHLGRQHDYIIVLGTTNKLRSQLLKKPHQFPFAKLLKNGGKAIVVSSQVDDTLTEKQQDHVQIFTLDATRTFSAEALSNRILKALFTSKAIYKKDPVATQPSITSKKHKTKTTHTYKVRLMLVLLTLFLFLSPVLVFLGTLGISAFWINQALTQTSPLENRKTSARYAVTSAGIANSMGSFLEAISSPFSHSVGAEFEGLGELTFFLAKASEDGLEVEETLRGGLQALFQERKVDVFEKDIPSLQKSLGEIETDLSQAADASRSVTSLARIPFVNRYYPLTPKLDQARRVVGEGKDAVVLIPELLAFHGQRTYLLLFQNNFELRPTGGFIGSFGLLSVANGSITNMSVEDIYEADGQLKGNVVPPQPIQQYLNQPNWFLRDSNWHPDFSVSAKQAEWFLEKETGKSVDGVIAVDLYFVKQLLGALDGVYVPDYKARVTTDDFFIKLQSDTHDDFFPGSNEKKNLLSSLLTALTIELKDRQTLPYPQLVNSLTTSLTEKNVLLYFHDQKSQDVVEKLGWGGKLIATRDQGTSITPVILDYVMVVEANLGVNKANYFLSRELLTTVTATENEIKREVTVYYKNSSPRSASLFGGTYKNYVRVLLPKNAEIESIVNGDKKLILDTEVTSEIFSEKKAVGFLVEVPEQTEKKITIRYSLPTTASRTFSYFLIVQKQPGTGHDPFVFKTQDSNTWNSTTTTIPSLPYLSDLSVDRLLSLDFARKIE